jgi:drug/metabolite transporter (DMT)-like permease
VIFSAALPATSIAVRELSPGFLSTSRAAVAAVLAAAALIMAGARRPSRTESRGLALVAAAAIIGAPLLTSISLQDLTSSHAAVVTATLPAITAVLVVLRTREHPGTVFWVLAALGCLAAIAFAGARHGGAFSLSSADLVLLGAVACSAVGYSEGAVVARSLGAWQTICWSLVIAAPVTVVASVIDVLRQPPQASLRAWLAVFYLGAFCMFLGYFAWYSGLAAGPIAQVSQIQLIQPVLTVGWAVVLLGEGVTAAMVMAAAAVALLSGLASTARGEARAPAPPSS